VTADDFGLIDNAGGGVDEPFATRRAADYRVADAGAEKSRCLVGRRRGRAVRRVPRHRFSRGRGGGARALPGRCGRGSAAAGRAYPKARWAPQVLRAKSTLTAGTTQRRGVCGACRRDGRGGRGAAVSGRVLRRAGRAPRRETAIVAAMRRRRGADPLARHSMRISRSGCPGDILTKVDRRAWR
jgi:asparagine synthase (glutamine-hydrolysing)